MCVMCCSLLHNWRLQCFPTRKLLLIQCCTYRLCVCVGGEGVLSIPMIPWFIKTQDVLKSLIPWIGSGNILLGYLLKFKYGASTVHLVKLMISSPTLAMKLLWQPFLSLSFSVCKMGLFVVKSVYFYFIKATCSMHKFQLQWNIIVGEEREWILQVGHYRWEGMSPLLDNKNNNWSTGKINMKIIGKIIQIN